MVGINADQMGIDGSMMNCGQRQAMRDDGLREPFISVGNSVRGIEQPLFGQSGEGSVAVRECCSGFSE